jgi:hypothetical protein
MLACHTPLELQLRISAIGGKYAARGQGMLKEHLRRVKQGLPRAYPVLTGRSPGSTPFSQAEDIYHVACTSRECWFWAEYMLELWEKANVVEENWDRGWNKNEVWHMLEGKLTVEFEGQDRTGG